MKAFVRAVSEDICNKLNELGFEDCWTGYIHSEEVKTITMVFDGKWSLTGFDPSMNKNETWVDCGNNVELFFKTIIQ